MRRTLIGLVAGVALIAAACGGDDSDNGDAEAAAETTETTAGSDTGDDAAAAQASPAAEPGKFADTPFCEEFRTLEAGEDEAELVETLRSLEPPEELQTDMTTLADTLEELSALDVQNNPDALNEPENQETFTAFQQAGLNIQTSCTEGPPPGGAPPDDGSGDAPEDG